jgi:signal peptidase I
VNLNTESTPQLRVRRTCFIRRLRLTLAVLPLAAWALWFRPEFLGGRVDYIIVGGRSMLPALHGGDLVVVQRERVYRVGDVVAYHIPDGIFRGRRIIHRIVGGDAVHGFVLRGDNNAEDDLWYPRQANIEGKLWLRIPAAGQVVALARSPGVLAAVAGGFVFAFVMTSAGDQRRGALSATTGLGEGLSAKDP